MALRSMLLAMDDSDDGHAAIAVGIRWATAGGARLAGVAFVNDAAVRQPEPVPIGGATIKDEADRKAVHEAQSRAQRTLEKFREDCRESRIDCEEIEVVTAEPEYLSREVQRHDILLMGVSSNYTYGVRDVNDQVLESIVRQSPRPVVAIPKGAHGEGRILVAYDGSMQAARALQALVATGLPIGKEVTVVSVNDENEELARQSVDLAR